MLSKFVNGALLFIIFTIESWACFIPNIFTVVSSLVFAVSTCSLFLQCVFGCDRKKLLFLEIYLDKFLLALKILERWVGMLVFWAIQHLLRCSILKFILPKILYRHWRVHLDGQLQLFLAAVTAKVILIIM